MKFTVINPSNDEVVQSYPEMSSEEVEACLRKSVSAFASWRRLPVSQRTKLLEKLRLLLLERKEEYARLMTAEMGKPLPQAASEVEKCAATCAYYAAKAEEFLAPQPVATDALKSTVVFEPLGPVLGIMPWNFPFWQVFRSCLPVLVSGNTYLLKHSPHTLGCASSIADLFRQSGFPEGVFQSLVVDLPAVEKLIADPRVRAVTLTGSVRAGRSVAALAGRALKKCVLELGGSDPFIVLEDADLDKAVEVAVQSRILNTGQSCIAAKRFIVVDAVRQKFEKKLVEKMKALKMGDPFEEGIHLGPMARKDLRDTLHDQVIKSVEKGARLILGGVVPKGPGAFYPPTILTDVSGGMPAYEEELFGPVAPLIAVPGQEEAIRVANDTSYGLGATVMTKDREKGERIAANEIESGACFVNSIVKSDARLPFGGIKNSGFGRELSHFGVHEFVNIKTVYVN